MQRSTFDDSMRWLLKHYKVEKRFDDRLEDIWRFWGEADDDVFIAAVNLIIREYQEFPTLAEVSDAVVTSREAIDKKRNKKQAEEKRTRMEHEVPKVNSEMGRRVVGLMDRKKLPETEPNRLTTKQLAIVMITEMEKEFPNNGWQEEGRRLLDWIEKRPAIEEKRQASIFVQRQQKIRP